ncbi:MAG: demethoxyubiquinone hydroxylase family protein [Alphaproteobacteria bacterium]
MRDDTETPRRGLRRLPGDPPRREILARMVRVNQAGEYAAMRIHQGQLAVLGSRSGGAVLKEMTSRGEEHLRTFDRIMVERRVRPTLLQPLWHVLGFALGAGTAFLGEKAAMACTVALGEVIEEQLAGQVEALGADEPALRETIERHREDENGLRDIGLANGATQHPAYPILSAAIRTGSRMAAWLSTRL